MKEDGGGWGVAMFGKNILKDKRWRGWCDLTYGYGMAEKKKG